MLANKYINVAPSGLKILTLCCLHIVSVTHYILCNNPINL